MHESTIIKDKINIIQWCKGYLHFLDPPGPLTALASYPGSGNTWLRYLIQQATGIATGSVYNAAILKVRKFQREIVVSSILPKNNNKRSTNSSPKGQTILKANYGVLDSSKKTNKTHYPEHLFYSG